MKLVYTSPIVERLHDALRLRERSSYWLQQQLSQQDVPGSSTGSVNRYVRGELTPPIEFLQAAAQALQVFEPWLLSGYGNPDGPEEVEKDPKIRQLKEMSEGMEKLIDKQSEDDRNVEYRIAERFRGYRRLRPSTREIVLELFDRCGQYTEEHRFCLVPWDRFRTRYGLDLELALQLGGVLYAPFRMLGLDKPIELPHTPSEDRVNQCVIELCTAILTLLPERREPTLEEIAEAREWDRLRRESVRRYEEQARETPPRRRAKRRGGRSGIKSKRSAP